MGSWAVIPLFSSAMPPTMYVHAVHNSQISAAAHTTNTPRIELKHRQATCAVSRKTINTTGPRIARACSNRLKVAGVEVYVRLWGLRSIREGPLARWR
jgi:hypothetical protein